MRFLNIKTQNQRGQLLLEALIAIAIIVGVVTVGSQMIIVSMKGNKFSNKKNVALGFLEKTFEAVEAVSMEKWQNVYKPPTGSGDQATSKGSSNHYHATQSGGKWVIAAGDDTANANGLDYTVYFTIDNVSRDSNKNVESSYNASRDDPSTQKITATVNWTGAAEPLTLSQYISRWRNQACLQSDWSGSPTSATTTCPTSNYGGDGANIDRSGGALKLDPL
ncbi:hypothetical protein HY798_03250 [Candidatus Falkowbacteria bacterium]|nr:hypothetical protein [Candidatus Falkowbacteria bacterium]